MKFTEIPIIRKILARNDGRRILVIIAAAFVTLILLMISLIIILSRGGKTAETSAETPTETAIATIAPTIQPTQLPIETPIGVTEVPAAEPAQTETPTEEPLPTPEPAPYANFLTGEPLYDEATALRRPIAIVINNAPKSLPQYGISQASLYYEVLAEGDITRIITLFQDFDAEKIGSIRSARHYFLNFAYDNDALFMHYGGSPQLYAALKAAPYNNFDGMRASGDIIWRDMERYKTKGMSEHSAYVTAADIFKQTERFKYRAERNAETAPLFAFYAEASAPENATPCTEINVPYLPKMVARFTYNEQEKKYYKFQNGAPHLDADAQLKVTNVIIQQAKITLIKGDSEGRRDAELVGSGTGWLATNGTYAPIKWEKADLKTSTKWTFADGTPLTLNVGKTWVCVVGYEREVTFE